MPGKPDDFENSIPIMLVIVHLNKMWDSHWDEQVFH